MTTLLLVATLLMLPVTDGPGDDNNDGSTPPPAKVPDYATYKMLDKSGHFWFNLQYGFVDQYYNQDADLAELGEFTLQLRNPATGEVVGEREVDVNATIDHYALHAGGSYTVHRIGDLAMNVGGDLSFVNQIIETDSVTVSTPLGPQPIPETQLSSGFNPQNLLLFGELNAPRYALHGGYLFDLGPDPDEEEETRHNSDRQDALWLGVSGQYMQPSFRLFGGFDYFLNFEHEGRAELPTGEEGTATFDEGDVYKLHAGGGLRFLEAFEIGATLIYRAKSEGTINDVEGGDVSQAVFPGQPNPYDSSQILSIAPYLNYRAADSPFQLYLKGAVQREYFDYGYAVAGTNDIAPRFGLTLGAKFGV